jgi:hypothetical protein
MTNHIKLIKTNTDLWTDLSISVNRNLEVVDFVSENGIETKEDCQKIIDFLFKEVKDLVYNWDDDVVSVTIRDNGIEGSFDVYVHIDDELDEDQTPILSPEDIDVIFSK